MPLFALVLLLAALQSASPTKIRNVDAEVIDMAILQFFTRNEENWWQRGEWRNGTTVVVTPQYYEKTRGSAAKVLEEWIESSNGYESNPKDAARARRELAPLRAMLKEVKAAKGDFRTPKLLAPMFLDLCPNALAVEPIPGPHSWRGAKLPSGIRGSIRALASIGPPSYSLDGRFALVKMSVAWSIHSADVLIGLRQDSAGWKRIFARSFFYV